ncbi:MAG: pilin [Dehalococcoidia bacterium]|nr:pilin [Dehalococcoidia bacterium]
MKKLLRVFLLVTTCYWLFAISFPSPARAECYDTPGVATDVGTIGCLEVYIQNLIAFIFPIAGAVALFFLIIGGIRFVTSGGEPKAVETAKKTLTYAVMGLALIFLVFFILKGVILPLTGVDLTRFNIVLP